MPKKPSAEYVAFDATMGKLLRVPKAELDARVKAHKDASAMNPNRRGPKPKVKTDSSSVPATGDEAS